MRLLSGLCELFGHQSKMREPKNSEKLAFMRSQINPAAFGDEVPYGMENKTLAEFGLETKEDQILFLREYLQESLREFDNKRPQIFQACFAALESSKNLNAEWESEMIKDIYYHHPRVSAYNNMQDSEMLHQHAIIKVAQAREIIEMIDRIDREQARDIRKKVFNQENRDDAISSFAEAMQYLRATIPNSADDLISVMIKRIEDLHSNNDFISLLDQNVSVDAIDIQGMATELGLAVGLTRTHLDSIPLKHMPELDTAIALGSAKIGAMGTQPAKDL